jgi:chitodextrinase
MGKTQKANWRRGAACAAVTALLAGSAGAGQQAKTPAQKAAPSSAAAQIKAPTGLVAVSATRSEVRLRWAAGEPGASYVVERRSPGGRFNVVAQGGGREATDTKFAAYATYAYRVRAVAKDGEKSEPSNEITVGPPPAGFSLAAAAPPGGREGNYGRHAALTLDANDDAAVAFVYLDPNRDTREDDNTFYFVAWDRARYAWKEPVLVDEAGRIVNGTDQVQVSAARDAATNTLGIAYQKNNNEVWLALSSDGGATWTKRAVHRNARENFCGLPSLAMRDGRLHLVWFEHAAGFRYATREGNSGEFTVTSVPLPAGAELRHLARPSLALDAAGRPGVAYWVELPEKQRVVAAYWRPGETQPAVITEASKATAGEKIFVELAYEGAQPRVALLLGRNTDEAMRHDILWYVASEDGGRWSEPAAVPRDGDARWDPPLALAVDGKGRAGILAASLGVAPAKARAACGVPKLAQLGRTGEWRTCSPDARNAQNFTAWGAALAAAGNDKFYAAFQNTNAAAKIGAGVVVWREQ